MQFSVFSIFKDENLFLDVCFAEFDLGSSNVVVVILVTFAVLYSDKMASSDFQCMWVFSVIFF